MGVSFSKNPPTGGVKTPAIQGSAYDSYMGSHQIVGSTVLTKKSGQVEKQVGASSEVVHPGVMVPDAKLFKLTVSGGRTLNLGNFESARVDVGITVPTTKEELNEAYDFATNWISEKIEAAVKGAQNGS